MNESRTLANYVVNTSYEDLPAEVVEVQKKALLDAISVTLAASTLGEGCREFVELAMETGGKPESTIIGFDTKVPAMMAAFANASMAHSLDFEDAYDKALLHPNAAAIPAALAVSEALGNVNGKELITALVLGSDIACRMGLALNEDLLKYGWYMPPVMGAFGATAAVCKLLKLDERQVLDAFSLTLCQATCSAEITHSPQSVIRSIREAFAAKVGVLSGLLAQKGARGFDQPLEGKAGFYFSYAKGNYDLSKLTEDLGNTYESANISFKKWPSCRGTHPYIDAALQIVKEYKLATCEIEKIHLVVSPWNTVLCEPLEEKQRPETPINAKFSIPFIVAAALVYGDVTLDHFTPEALQNPEVLALAAKVTYEVDKTLSREQTLFSDTQIFTKQGVLSRRVERPYGHPLNPISQEDLLAKLINCVKYSAKKISEKNIHTLAQHISTLEKQENVKDIVSLL